MSFLKKLFGGSGGGGSEAKAPTETHEGFLITATPMAEGPSYRICAIIEKEIDGETRSHKLIRSDMVQGLEDAQAASFRKAKQVIDEQGDRIFRS
ncbi:hypothetical protein CEP88_18755 [Roseobacter denitrificans]|uniref:Transcriptional activator HlyU n=1 Tax=Roseobacter denitrificans (strain ATCC 33942 / OCh 114) TaxID=375451 RepID=Q169D0_ROSDO|nr:HlyU family transcriptional regulator [Roseobacter denitrificans]ABG31413.1 conserved hypothetical protein [Roseobacter denitrificans OCh 114]AVL54431.1 hypothetical protein CEP88_18755 [Roseobacter denitrificans]SFG00915.1 hypothetical protein SAMN05443635_105233 [Roseobacter denitrificans OCh 114]